MTRFGLLLARITRNEAALARLSAPRDAIMAELAGKSVALIGNSRALAETAFGPDIDGADLVIRLNSAPIPNPRSHGTRTDWIAMSTPTDAATLAARAPRRLLWMTRKRRRLIWRIASHKGFYLNRPSDVAALVETLGAPPTTGLMMIDLLARSDLARLTLYGFDFFASQSLTGSRRADQVPHDFTAERAFVEALAARDARVSVQQG